MWSTAYELYAMSASHVGAFSQPHVSTTFTDSAMWATEVLLDNRSEVDGERARIDA
jgi:hypothetical protein